MKMSKRSIMLMAILVLVFMIAVYFYKVKEQFVASLPPAKVIGCENDKVPDFKCDKDFIVTDAKIQYGRWKNDTCGHDTVKRDTKANSVTVNIPDTYYKNKQNVVWGVNAQTLAGNPKDPMPGVYKHFEVTATCRKPPSTQVVLKGCDGGTMKELSCPADYVVDNATLKYGRWDNKTCKGKSNTIKDNTPVSFTEKLLPNSYWQQDKTIIKLNKKPSDIITDDPARDVYKHYQVTANCKLA